MIIDAVRLVNIGPHQDRIFNFSPFSNVIIGRNGTGKSTLINAIVLALTGLNRFPGVITDNISQFATADGNSYVEVCLRHQNRHMRLKRALRPATASLVVDDGKAITGINKVQTEILSLLGASEKQLADYVFVEQQKVAGWFDKTDAERAKEMAVLFGVANADIAHRSIGGFLSKIAMPTTILDAAAVQRAIADANGKLVPLQAQLQLYADVPNDLKEDRAAHQSLLTGAQSYKNYCSRLDAVSVNLGAKQQQLTETESKLGDLQVQEGIYATAIDADKANVATARQELTDWANYEKSQAAQQRYLQSRAEFNNLWKQRMRRPRKPGDYVEDTDLAFKTRYDSLQRQVTDLDSGVRQVKSLRPGQSCPTCGQPSATLAERLTTLQSQLDVVLVSFYPLQDCVQRTAAYVQAMGAYRMAIHNVRQRLASLRSQKESVKLNAAPARPNAILQEILADFDVLQVALSTLRQQRAAAAAVQTTLLQVITQLQGEQLQLMRAPVPEVSDAAVSVSANALAQKETRLQEKQSLQTTRRNIESELIRVESQLDDIAAVQAAAGRVQFAISKLELARDILHHNAAPRMVTHTRLEDMLEEINRSLELFAAPYRVTVDESLCFRANFLDGIRCQPDRRLSVGQKIVLALSLRIALNSTFARQLGHLSLDEPTAGLDATALATVPEAFSRLQELSHTCGLQVFLVTHEQRLIDTFDKVIEL